MALRTVFALLVFCAAGRTAAPSGETNLSEGLPDGLAAIVAAALSMPAELGAEALIRAAAAGGIQSEAKRIALLEKAREVGVHAKEPNARIFVGPRFPVTREFLHGLGYGFGLDQLSIAARSLTGIATMDKPRALDGVRRLVAHRLARRSCEDAFVDDVAIYYQLCGRIIDSAFSDEQRRGGEDIELAMAALYRISSAVELAPAAAMISSLQLAPGRMGQLAGVLAGVLDRVSDSDRSFSASLPRLDAAIRGALIPRLVKLEIDPRPMQTAYRDYLKRHADMPRCADNGAPGAPAAAALEKAIKYFDAIEGLKLEMGGVPAAAPQDAMRLTPLLSDEAHVLELAGALVFRDAATKTQYQPEERSTKEWRARFDEFVKAVQNLQPGPGQSAADLLAARQMLLGEAAALVPAGPEREILIKTYVALLAAAPLPDGSVLDWLVNVRSFLDVVRASRAGDLDYALALMERSANHVLAFYARMERALPAGR